MKRLARILEHRWRDETDTARALDKAALARLEARVAASERQHSGEIRLCVEAGLPLSYLWRRATARQRALALFGKLQVWDTEHNNGVLIYLLLAEHAIEVVVDRGLARQVPQAHWDTVVAGLREDLRTGRFESGLMQSIAAVEAVLLQYYAVAPGEDNPDELPNQVDLR